MERKVNVVFQCCRGNTEAKNVNCLSSKTAKSVLQVTSDNSMCYRR